MQPRPYQSKACREVNAAWNRGAQPLLVLPTGAGKTFVMAQLLKAQGRPSCLIAHRQELVTQAAKALARCGVRHSVLAPDSVVRDAIKIQRAELGLDFVTPNAPITVAGIGTLNSRASALQGWASTVGTWMLDEAHHLTPDSIWSRGISLFKNAKGLGVTATPQRADGVALGLSFDTLIVGPSMRELIDEGFLTDYRIFVPPSDIDPALLRVSKTTGDYTRPSLSSAFERSSITGDLVGHYLQHAAGKRGLAFVVDIEMAERVAEAFNKRGVPALAVSGKTLDLERSAAVRKLESGEVLQLINCDLFGEGFDVPAVEVVSFARPTKSLGVYLQQFGRVLRPMPGKTHGLVIDHVGNVLEHGLPDKHREWSLEGKKKKAASALEIPVRVCPACTFAYEAFRIGCPDCGFEPEPRPRGQIAEAAGDLVELSPDILAQLRGDIAAVDLDKESVRAAALAKRMPHVGQLAAVNRHVATQEAQVTLRSRMQAWGGAAKHRGLALREAQRLFFYAYGVDVLTAQTLKAKDAEALTNRISEGDIPC